MIAGDTLIHTLHGDVPVAVLAAKNATVYGFTWTGDRIGYARICVEPFARPMMSHRVVLDNGASIRVSNKTRFVCRDGESALAIALEGDSVMPLYLRTSSQGYKMYRQLREDRREAPAPSDRRGWRSIARMVAEQVRGAPLPAGYFVRHVDQDRTNCSPLNLELEATAKPTRKKARRADHLIAGHRATLPNNHKIVGEIVYGEEDGYDVTLIDASNFAAGEVFIQAPHGA